MNAATNINNTPAEKLTALADDAGAQAADLLKNVGSRPDESEAAYVARQVVNNAAEAGGKAARKIPAFFRRITLVEVALAGALVGCAVLAFRSFGGPVAEAVVDIVE